MAQIHEGVRYENQVAFELGLQQVEISQAWEAAIRTGAVLTFKINGCALTCGPHRPAVGPAGFSAYRYDARGREVASTIDARAWRVADWVVEQVARKRPEVVR